MKLFFLIFCSFFSLFAQSQIITTYAGGGTGNLGDGGPATLARIGYFGGVALDSHGNLYIADANNHRIRKVDYTTGIISTVAGDGTNGNSGDGGLATIAQMNYPVYIACDTANNLYISDVNSNVIRKVNASTGIITTIAGDGVAASTGDGGLATLASINGPEGIAFDTLGNMYVAEFYNKVRKIDPTGIITTIVGDGTAGFTGDDGPASQARISEVLSICVYHNSLYLGDIGNLRIRKIDLATDTITTVAGDGTGNYNGDNITAMNAGIGPFGITLDTSGNIFIADYDNYRIRKIDLNGIIHTVAGTGVPGFAGDGGSPDSSKVNHPEGVAVDRCGNLFIADYGNKRVRKITYDLTCSYSNPVDTTDTTTAIYSIAATGSISIYPNPAKEQLTITGGNGAEEVMIINAIGQLMQQQRYNGRKATINVSRLNVGIYYIIAKDEKNGNIVRMKFLKE